MNFSKIKDTTEKFYMPVFSRLNICLTHGNGNKVFDTNGKEYIDFTAGIAVNSLGYNHPKLVEAISAQAQKLIHVSNYFYTQQQAQFLELLLSDGQFNKAFLCNSGAEANEGAIKLIRRYFKNNPHKRTILSASGSFHGRTLASLTMTDKQSQHEAYTPLPQGFKFCTFNDFESLKQQLTDDVAAVILEPIQGECGVKPATFDFLVNAYAYCKSRGALFVLDEVQTGIGRTGKKFAFEHYGIQPDIITLAKGLGGGMPMGAILARGDAANAFELFDHGSTFGGNPLACACGTVVLQELQNGLLEHAALTGEFLGHQLSKLNKYKFVKEIRGRGLMYGIELVENLSAKQIAGLLASKGFLVNCAGNNTLRLVPPLTITNDEIEALILSLNEIFSKTNI